MAREEGWLQEDRNCHRPHFEAPEKTIELLFLDMCFVVFVEDQVTKVQLTKSYQEGRSSLKMNSVDEEKTQ